jgi:transposase
LHASEQNREDVKIKRENWKIKQSDMDISRLVFLDESGVNTGMTRLYGRAFEGERVVDYIPDVRFQRTSVLSSVRSDGSCVPIVFSGSLNGELFKQYLKEFLVPTLKEGDIVIMDNLSSHKVAGVSEVIENAGAKIMYLPPYSPDLNPIEQMWSKIKAYLRKIKARSQDSLYSAIKDAFDTITYMDISGWFGCSGYS